MNELGMSFWKLGPERRCQLVWDRVRQSLEQALGAARYVPKRGAREAVMFTPTAVYTYDVTIKSQLYVLKNFPHCSLQEIGDSDRYNVVFITVRPPFIHPGFMLALPGALTILRSHRDSTTVSTVARSHYVSDILLACNIWLRVLNFLKYREEYKSLILSAENLSRLLGRTQPAGQNILLNASSDVEQ